MGPQEDYIETVLTCEGDYYDPEFHRGLQHFSQKLESLINTANGKLILTKVEPWNSVRVTFNIPKEAAVRLKQLAEQGDHTLKDLGILAVQIEGDRSISLTIAGKNNETTELVFRTTNGGSANPSVFDSSGEDLLPGPGNLEATRANIAECLRAQGEAGPHLMGVFMQQQAPQAAPSVTIPTNPVNQPALYGSPSRSPSHSASSTGSQLPVPQGKSPPGFPSPSQSVSQQSFPSPGSSRSQPSPVSPQYPTPPPSQPSHPGSPGIRSNSLVYTHHNPTVNNVQGQRLNKDITSASPLLVNLLQTEVPHQQHFNNIPQLPMPPPFDGGPSLKKRRRTRKKDRRKGGPVEGEISVPGLPLPAGSETRVPPIAGSDNFMQQSHSPLGDGNLQGLASSLTASYSQPSTPSSQQAHSWVRHASSPSQVSGNVTPPVVLPHNNKNVRCSPDKPTNPQHIINPYTGQLEPVDCGSVPADTKDFVIKTEASDTFGDVSSQLKPPPNPLVAIQQHMAASENSGQQQHRVSSPSPNTSNPAGNSSSFLSGLRLPPYPSSTKPKPLHRSGSPANAGSVSVAVGSMTLPGSTNTGSMGYSSVLSGLKRSNPGLFAGSHSSSPSSSSQVPTTASNPRHRFSPVTSLTSSVSGSSSLVSTVSSVLSGEKNRLPDSRTIPNSPSDSQGRGRLNCGVPQAQNSSVTQGISIPSDRPLTVTSVASQVANVISYAANSDTLSRSAACSPVSQSLQKSRNIHSQSPTASLSLSVSQTLSAYPDRTLSSSLLPGLDSSGASDLRPSSTPLSSRSSTPKIKSEHSHESVTAILKEAASHFIPIPKDDPESMIPYPVRVKEEPVSKEALVRDNQKAVTASGEKPSTSQVAPAGVYRNSSGGIWATDQQHAKRMDTKSPSGAPFDSGLSKSDPQAVKSGTSETSVVPNLSIRTTVSLSGVVSSVSVASNQISNRPELQPRVKTNAAMEKQESVSVNKTDKPNNDYNVLVSEQTPLSEQAKNAGDKSIHENKEDMKLQSNHHGDAKTPPSPCQGKATTEHSHEMNNVDAEPHANDTNNCHDAVTDRLYDGKLLDVPPLLNPDQGVGISSVTQSDLQTIPRGSNGASLGEASPLSSDNASSTGQPNAGQSPITNMIGHLNHDSELSSHSFEDHVAVTAEESNNVPNRHNGGTTNKDRDGVPPQHPNQADHKNIITVGYAFSKDNPVDLNNGFANDKLFKNLNSMSYLTKSFLDLENNDVKGVRIPTDFLQKERINATVVRHSSQEADGERYRVKPSLMTENHLNLTSCLSLPAKLLGKSDLNPGGLPVDNSAADARINGSSSESAKYVPSVVTNSTPNATECSVNGSLPLENHDNGLPSRKSPLSKDADYPTGSEVIGSEEEKDRKPRSRAQTVMIISPPTLRTPEKLLPNVHIVSKNESPLPSSRATVWAGSKMAPLLGNDGETATRVGQAADLKPNTGSNTDNLASSRTVITAASSAPLFSSEMTKGGEGVRQGSMENCPTSSHQKAPSTLPSLIPADKSPGSGLLSTAQTQLSVTPSSGKTNGLGSTSPGIQHMPDKIQEVTSLPRKSLDGAEKDALKGIDGMLSTTPNGDHPGITGLLGHHAKMAPTKGISILKPLHDREEERDDDLLYTDIKKTLPESIVIAGHAIQDNAHKTAHSNIVINTILGEEEKAGKDVIRVSMPLVGSPHNKAARSNSYSKTNPTKSSFSEFPNNASRLSGFVSKSMHTPVHNSTSHTITAPGFHLNLTESVQRVIPSMDTLSPPHDKATFSLPRVNQSPPANLSPPAVEKRSPTQKVHSGSTTPDSVKGHSGKVTPELIASEDVRNEHFFAMAQRIYARTTVSHTQGSKSATSVPSSAGQTCSTIVTSVTNRTVITTPVPVDQLTAVKVEPVVVASVNIVSPSMLLAETDIKKSPVGISSSCASFVPKSETDSGAALVSSSSISDCHKSECLTVSSNAPESVKLETEDCNADCTLEIQTVSVAAKTEIVPLKSESVRTVESAVTTDGSDSKPSCETKGETSPAKVEVAARTSRRLQAKMIEQNSLEHEETGPGRPPRVRKYSTESIKSESSEVQSEGMNTRRSGRTRRASTESSKSVEEHGRSSRVTRCSSRESVESRSGSRESGHGKEESPKGASTRSRKTSGSSEDLIEERKTRLGDLRTGTPSPTPRATRTSTRSVRKKVPDGFVDERPTPANKTPGDADSCSKTRGSKRRLTLDEPGPETPVEKKAKNEELTSEDTAKGKAAMKAGTGLIGETIGSSVANRVRGKQDAIKTPVKDSVIPQKVSPSKENVADEHSYSNKKTGKAKPAVVAKKPVIPEQKTPVTKARQMGRSKSPVPEVSGRNRSSKQPSVEEKLSSASAASTSTASSTSGPTPVKRSTRSTRTKDVAEPVGTPSTGKRRRVSRDQR